MKIYTSNFRGSLCSRKQVII